MSIVMYRFRYYYYNIYVSNTVLASDLVSLRSLDVCDDDDANDGVVDDNDDDILCARKTALSHNVLHTKQLYFDGRGDGRGRSCDSRQNEL
jgi:hypothetical protein